MTDQNPIHTEAGHSGQVATGSVNLDQPNDGTREYPFVTYRQLGPVAVTVVVWVDEDRLRQMIDERLRAMAGQIIADAERQVLVGLTNAWETVRLPKAGG